MHISLKVAQLPEERFAIEQLYQAVYAMEWGHDTYPAPAGFRPPFDTMQGIFARVEGEMVGCVDLQTAPSSDEHPAFGAFGLARFKGILDSGQIFLLSRFAVRQDWHESTVPFSLLKMAVAVAMKQGAELVLCACQPHLVPLYHRLGFRHYQSSLLPFPHTGPLVPLALILGDMNHLENIRSPLRSLLLEHPVQHSLIARLLRLLHQTDQPDLRKALSSCSAPESYQQLAQQAHASVLFLAHRGEAHVQAFSPHEGSISL